MRPSPPQVLVGSLYNDLDALGALLRLTATRTAWLDAFLVAAGMRQIVEDRLRAEPELPIRAARYLSGRDGWPASAAAATARAVARGGGALAELRTDDHVWRWDDELARLVDRLADCVARDAPSADDADLAARCHALVDGLGLLPHHVRRHVMTQPACFRIFDQHPSDVRELVDRFARARPRRDRPLLVAGARTSGSYLAPLTAAFLRRVGYTDVHTLTVRPGRRLERRQRRLIRSVARRGGLALVSDDPPVTGRSVVEVARQLERAGPLEVVLLLAVFGSVDAAPARLTQYPCIALEQADWWVTAQLAPDAVRAAVSALLGPALEAIACERLPGGTRREPRGHVRALYRLGLRPSGHHDVTDADVLVEGVGLGYLGAQALRLHAALDGFLPRVLGLRDGLVYREWLPDTGRADRLDADERDQIARRIAAYVHARTIALPLREDHTLGLDGDRPAWELAAIALSQAFGRASPAARVLLVDRAVRRLMTVARPSVIDGCMELSRWFTDPARGELVKVDWAESSDARAQVASCDPVSDLAQVTARSQDQALARPLRGAYEELAHERVDPERWLLLQLGHVASRRRWSAGDDLELVRSSAQAMQAYVHELYFRDLEPSTTGPLCGIDVDGVLELETLGFPAMPPAAAGALRALVAHGHRPLLVTGRSGPEMVQRCHAYRLAGGVAEYGAVAYAAGAGGAWSLLSAEQAASLDRLRGALRELDGVHVDAAYRHAVRAYRLDDAGGRRRLTSEDVAAAVARAGSAAITTIHGDGQTDLVPGGIDKGVGTRALARRLGADPATTSPLAFAVGDTISDLPLLALAARPFVPAHADARLRARARATRRPYQAGFAEAVQTLIGHRPGGCRACRMPEGDDRRRLLLALLALREGGLRGLPHRTLRAGLAR